MSSASTHAVKGVQPKQRADKGGGGGEPDPEIVDTAAKFVQVSMHIAQISSGEFQRQSAHHRIQLGRYGVRIFRILGTPKLSKYTTHTIQYRKYRTEITMY